MQNLLRQNQTQKFAFRLLTFISLIFLFTGCKKGNEEPVFEISTVATGLAAPMGIEYDRSGNIWVAIAGTGNNDGKVVVIKPNGIKYDAIINLPSLFNEGGELGGPTHLLMDNNTLYILSNRYLYRTSMSAVNPGQSPVDAATLSRENIGSFVLSYPFINNTHDTHPYNLVKGPDGDLYIADAAANAIIHRKSEGNYSILAEVPGIANPTPVGPPMIQGVPTGIIFDGHNFLVTTLTGFPFPAGSALVYKVSMTGDVSVYQNGFTTLVDIVKGNTYGHMVLQYATFGPMGFMPNTGALLAANGNSINQLAGALNMPAGITQANDHTWYITSMGDGTVLKAAYNYK